MSDLLRPSPAGGLGEGAVWGFLAGNGLTHVLRAHNSTVGGVSAGKDAHDIAICSTSSVGRGEKEG